LLKILKNISENVYRGYRSLLCNSNNTITINFTYFSFYLAPQPPSGPGPPYSRGFTITLRRITVGRTLLDEWSARRRDFYFITHNTHNKQTSMPPVGFEPIISAGDRPQTYALDRAATGTGTFCTKLFKFSQPLIMCILNLPLYIYNNGYYYNHYCTLLCWMPPWTWPKKVETCGAVFWNYYGDLSYCKEHG